MDKTDLRILDLLQSDATRSTADIADAYIRRPITTSASSDRASPFRPLAPARSPAAALRVVRRRGQHLHHLQPVAPTSACPCTAARPPALSSVSAARASITNARPLLHPRHRNPAHRAPPAQPHPHPRPARSPPPPPNSPCPALHNLGKNAPPPSARPDIARTASVRAYPCRDHVLLHADAPPRSTHRSKSEYTSRAISPRGIHTSSRASAPVGYRPCTPSCASAPHSARARHAQHHHPTPAAITRRRIRASSPHAQSPSHTPDTAPPPAPPAHTRSTHTGQMRKPHRPPLLPTSHFQLPLSLKHPRGHPPPPLPAAASPKAALTPRPPTRITSTACIPHLVPPKRPRGFTPATIPAQSHHIRRF